MLKWLYVPLINLLVILLTFYTTCKILDKLLARRLRTLLVLATSVLLCSILLRCCSFWGGGASCQNESTWDLQHIAWNNTLFEIGAHAWHTLCVGPQLIIVMSPRMYFTSEISRLFLSIPGIGIFTSSWMVELRWDLTKLGTYILSNITYFPSF